MSRTPREIGTLAVVVLKARNLPNKRHIGKQDPYCIVVFNKEKQKTRAIKRGGQHPEWDAEFRFKVYDDDEDQLQVNGSAEPPPPPPKKEEGKKTRKIKGGMSMAISCYADDPKEPEFIGETSVDLTEVLTKGETDEWFTFLNKDKYSGEVYLELTFYSNQRPPEKKAPKKLVKANKQYGGPGSFVPPDDSAVPSAAGSRENSRNKDNIPSSLRASSSIAQLDLYIPPYEKNSTFMPGRRQASGVDRLADEFGGLSVNNPSRRRESFPPPHGHLQRPASDSAYSTTHSHHESSYGSGSEYGDPSYYNYDNYDRTTTPVGRPAYHRNSFGEQSNSYQSYISSSQSQSSYDSQTYQQPGYSPSRGVEYGAPSYPVPASSSGFVPTPTPAPSTFLSISSSTTVPSGFVPHTSQTPAPAPYNGPSQTPAPYNGPSQTPAPYNVPSQTPVPTGYSLSQATPASIGFDPRPAGNATAPPPPPSSMGFHPHVAPQSQTWSYATYPQPPVSAPPISYPQSGPLAPASVPPLSQSAPPQQQHEPAPSPTHTAPSPQPYTTPTPQPYAPYQPTTPPPAQVPTPAQQLYNPSPPVHGSRPLPQPQPVQSQGSPYGHALQTPPHHGPGVVPAVPSPTQHAVPLSASPHGHGPLPNPPLQPPVHPQPPVLSQPHGHTIPPPPPLPSRNTSPMRTNIPPPPPLPTQRQTQPQYTHSYTQDSASRPPLPQPPQMHQSVSLPNFGAIPPPPPLPIPPAATSAQLSQMSHSPSHQSPSHPLPQPPLRHQLPPPPPLLYQANGAGSMQYLQQMPGPPPRPPSQSFSYGQW